jgi:hypothetical protein
MKINNENMKMKIQMKMKMKIQSFEFNSIFSKLIIDEILYFYNQNHKILIKIIKNHKNIVIIRMFYCYLFP